MLASPQFSAGRVKGLGLPVLPVKNWLGFSGKLESAISDRHAGSNISWGIGD